MKLITKILVIVVIIFNSNIYGQQLSQYTQYMFNNYMLNPAVAGSSKCLDIKTGYRTQWLGFENRPKTGFVSAYKMLNFKRRPMMHKRHALGGYFENDNTGPISMRNSFYLSYTIQTPLSKNIWLGAGIFGGLMLYSTNSGGLVTASPNDAAISAAKTKFIIPDFSPGIWIYSPTSYIGVAVKSIVGNTIYSNSTLTRHYYLTGGHKFDINKTWAFITSGFLRYSYAAPVGIDANLMVDYDGQFEFGASYRITEGIAALIKFNIQNITIGYAYDYNLFNMRLASSNTHEIMLGIKICNGERAINVNGRSSPDVNRCPAFN